jgi:hypothetical protein
MRDRWHGDRLAGLEACHTCGDCAGPLMRWAPPGCEILDTLERAGVVRAQLFCDACMTCAACRQLVAPGLGMPRTVHLPAFHRACLSTEQGRAALGELRRMLGGGGAPLN